MIASARRLLVTAFSLFIFHAVSTAQGSSYTRIPEGLIVYPNPEFPGQTGALKVQVISDHIIRVTASPAREFPVVKSLMLSPSIANPAHWDLVSSEHSSNLLLKTSKLNVKINLNTAQVSFSTAEGKEIIAEKAGRKLEPVIYEGEQSWSIHQGFTTSADDAWYGLGQHQDGIMNYRGYQVFLFQNNTEVAVPFLVSRNNYGILWDNNSITRAGDTRPYKDLSRLQLFSSQGEAGWLTATYYNDRNKADVLMQKAESSIRYEYLNDSKLNLPASFKPETGKIVWEGSIASGISGTHHFRVTYGGYMKIWVDGKLLLDRWRQAWNPGSAILDINLQKEKRMPIRIEWIPDGGESYATCKWMEPESESEANSFAFSSEAGKREDYYFIYGNNLDEVIGGYRSLTGKATMLPAWAFGLWQSRERYRNQQDILGTVQEFRKRGIPLDNIVQDWFYWKENDWGSQDFDASRFPSPDSMISALHQKYNTHFMISVWPKFYEGTEAYRKFDSKGWLYKRNIADRQRDWVGPGYVSTFYDPFNENAQKGFWDLIHQKIYTRGVDAWWMDASEPDILSNVSPEKRKQQMYPLAGGITSEYLNAYPLVNAKGIYEGQRATDPGKRVFILTRSAFPGLQRYAAATWSGDISSRWHDMKLQISAGINFSLSGLPYWSMDIGGFAVERRFTNPDTADLEEWREMNARWYQFGAFAPLFRVHGQFPYREIYNVSPETHTCYQTMLYYDRLRYRLMPYIYSLAGATYHRDYTIMRGLVMDFPRDEKAININDQYMFGPSLLVNPVYHYRERTRELYLPGGQGWYDLYSGKYWEGGQSIVADAPYNRVPVFARAGAIIPFGPAIQYTNARKADTITLYVFGGRDGEFTLYEDEGTNYGYENKAYANIRFQYSDANHKLTVSAREGSFPGMLEKRYFRIKLVTREKPVALDLDKKEGKLVKYSGSAEEISLR
jgi:alpha-D-xyloside xylohydrolase